MTSDDGTHEEAKVSERTCVGCRQPALREELVRLAIGVDDGVATVVPDLTRKLGGRGASVHATRECIDAAVHRGGLAKAARARVDVTPAALVTMLEGQLIQRAKGLLLGAIRSRGAVLGADGTEKAIAERRVVALVLATDASARTAEIAGAIGRLGGRAIPLVDKKELGGLVGRDEVAVIGIEDQGIADALLVVARQLSGVRGGNQLNSDGGSQGRRPEAG